MSKTKGTVLKKGTATIGELTRIGEISLGEVEEREITSVQTLTGENFFKTFEAGLADAGEIEIEGLIKDDDTGQADLISDIGGANDDFTIEHPSGAETAFNAFVKSFKIGEATLDGDFMFTCTLRISGAPVFTPATA